MTKQKRLGQYFLLDPSIIKKIIDVAKLHADDIVLEIGPGLGRMTKMLAKKVSRVIAVEIDIKLYERLKEELSEYKNIELVLGDAMKYPYEVLPDFKIVANIPYYITTPLLFRLLKNKKIYYRPTDETVSKEEDGRSKNNIKSITLTVQKEVAERIIAKPNTKHYGLLSIMVNYYAKPRLSFIIPRRAFKPIPKVDSAVIHLEVYEKPPVYVKNEDIFFRIIKTAFSKRRKILSNSLKSINPNTKQWLLEAGIDPRRRAETLTLEEIAKLSNLFHPDTDSGHVRRVSF